MSESTDITSNNSKALSDQEYPWQEKTWQHFIKAKAQNQLPHAILLSGEEGIGKYSLAQRMAKSLMCINSFSADKDACNECQSCRTYESGANPDFKKITLLEDKQQIGVDQIRALSEFLNYSRSYNTNRVVILNPVERMNVNAANSLLKSLEEPSAHTVIILVTAKMNQLLPTIKSRCQLFTVTSPNRVETINWLEQYQDNNLKNQQGINQTLNIDPKLLLEISGTKPLNAIKLNQDDIDNRKHFFNDLIEVINRNTSLTEIAKKWEKHDVETLLNWQIQLVQNNIKSTITSSLVSDSSSSGYYSVTQHLSTEEHWLLYQNLIKQKQYIHTSVNSLMFMENMIMLWTKTI
ncbi:MAG: DNA polymerase-3 subunit delta' [Cocleimonas sp.]|jgi:DNA polymerase-3 subunit delta'